MIFSQRPVTNRIETVWVRLSMLVNLLGIAWTYFDNLGSALRAVKKLKQLKATVNGGKKVIKYAKADGKYFSGLNIPAWPSLGFDAFILNEFAQAHKPDIATRRLTTLIFSITKSCSLQCEHCFEWADLNDAESLSNADLRLILNKFQASGISQVQISGGEPLNRFEVILDLLEHALPDTDFWILTSGYGLSREKAQQLKDAGLVGVNISLDHFERDNHDKFRGMAGSYDWVQQAAQQCRAVGLQVCFTICATNDFISSENLHRYLQNAQDQNAGFVQILEPRAVGHYAGETVALRLDKIKILEDFFMEVNSKQEFRNYPIIAYPGYYQRRHGCFGSGVRYAYMDTHGNLHSCPFCRKQTGSCLDENIPDLLQKTLDVGCHVFNAAE